MKKFLKTVGSFIIVLFCLQASFFGFIRIVHMDSMHMDCTSDINLGSDVVCPMEGSAVLDIWHNFLNSFSSSVKVFPILILLSFVLYVSLDKIRVLFLYFKRKIFIFFDSLFQNIYSQGILNPKRP